MKECLLFQIYGPMASWGQIAVGDQRPSDSHPTKSAILGLISASLGIKREEEEINRDINNSYGLAIRTDIQGTLVQDFHTVEVPSSTSLKAFPHKTRFDEIKALRAQDNPVVSKREYWCDSFHLVGIWERENTPFSLEKIKKALEYPKFNLSLGRKSCPISLPLMPEIHEGETLKEVFNKYEGNEALTLFTKQWYVRENVLWFWDEDWENPGFESYIKTVRRDVSTSKDRWHFSERKENQWVEVVD